MPSCAGPPLLVTALIVAASIVLTLVRPRGIAEVWRVSGGVVLLVLLGLRTPAAALAAASKGSDVYFFLTGMMLLSALASAHGVFDWLSSVAVNAARGSRRRLFAAIYGVGTIVTILMPNDATAVVLTPAILAAVRKAKAPPPPYLFACALIANAASFVLPISNPANLVLFHGATPSLGRWLAAFALPSALSIATTCVVLASFTVGIANNLPLGLTTGATFRSATSSPSLTHATLLGVNLGPNLVVTGSLATLLWLLALRKEELDVSFWAFLKVGAIAMPAALLAATLGSLAGDTLWGNDSPPRPVTGLSRSPLPTPKARL